MNCPNCGATMELKEGRGYFVCSYCTTFHFPDESSQSIDGVIDSGKQAELGCPVCETRLNEGTIEGRCIFHCGTCRGVLATNADFGMIVKQRRGKYEGPESTPVPLNPDELRRKLRCPRCGDVMDVHPYYGPGNIAVDTCARCFLIWLDHGEIGKIEKAPGGR